MFDGDLAAPLQRTVDWRRLLVLSLAIVAAGALEALLIVEPGGATPLMLSCGALAGSFLIAHRSIWGALIALTMLVRLALTLFVEQQAAFAYAFMNTVLVVLLASSYALPTLLFPDRFRDRAPAEVVPISIYLGLIGAALLGGLHALLIPDSPAGGGTTLFVLAFMAGLTVGAPPMVVWMRRSHLSRPRTLGRQALQGTAIVVFVVGLFAALAHLPAGIYGIFERYPSTWQWIAIVAGVLVAVRIESRLSMIFASAAVTVSALLAFRLGYLSDRPGPDAVANWQIDVLGLMLVLISANSLIASVRRGKDQRRAQQALSRAMLARDDEDEAALSDETFRAALRIVCECSEADAVFVHWLDLGDRRMGRVHAWPPRIDNSESADIKPIRTLMEQLMRGTGLHLSRHAAKDVRSLAHLTDERTITAFVQAIVTGNRPVGLITLAAYRDRRFVANEISPLLATIGEFFVAGRARERADAARQNYQNRLRELAARTVQAEERVRRQTAVELHDGLIQRLAVARMKLGELRQRAGDGTVNAVTDIVDQSLAASRSIIDELSPSVVYELGLAPGLEKLLDDLGADGRFALTLREHGEGHDRLPESTRVGVYEVVRELISNSIAHSAGDQIWVDVYWADGALDAIVVSDNGRAHAWWDLTTAADEPSGLGLLSASERLRPLGYSIRFERRLGGGTRAILYRLGQTAIAN